MQDPVPESRPRRTWRNASSARAVSLLQRLGLLALAAMVLVLVHQNQRLQQQLRQYRIDIRVPHAGHFVPTFRTATLDGDSVTVGDAPPGGYQLLLVFNSRCQYCLRTIPHWKSIIERSNRSGSGHPLSVFGISLDSLANTRDYVTQQGIDFPVVRFPDARTAAVYRAIGVPLTVVLGNGGEVLYGRAGELSARESVDSVVALLTGQTVRSGQ